MTQADERLEPTEHEAPTDRAATSSDDDEDRPRITRGQALFRMALMTLVLLVLVEVGARVAFRVHRNRVDAAAAQEYAPHTYIGDFAAKVDYRFINFYTIDPARANNEEYDFDSFGFRLDAQKLRFDAPSPFKKIWLFGGSTMQGLGARGNETIAAHINALLEKEHSQYRAINMGQGGFTSTQELLLLIELLQSGHKPDAIVSYDGATECPFPGDLTKAGVPGWEKHSRKAALLLDVQGDDSTSTLLPLAFSRTTRIDDVMLAIQKRLSPAVAATHGGFDADNWEVVMRRYLATLNLIKAAAEQQGAPSFFFFQPIMQYEDHYKVRTFSQEEEKYRARLLPDEYKRREALHDPSLDALRSGLGDRLFDLHDVFRGHDGEKLYSDPRHANGAGNALIAARIYEEIRKLPSPSK